MEHSLEEYEIIKQSFFKVTDDFLANNRIIFEDPSILKHLHFSHAEETLKSWKKSKLCIYKNCKNKSVPKSHTIQKASSIRFISENGMVLTPFFDQKIGKVTLKRIGINEASTFPGFCEEHEKIFFNFENNKQITVDKDIQLQVYRTICREIVVKRQELQSIQNFKKNYLEIRDKKILELLLSNISNKTSVKDLSVKKMKFRSGDIILSQLDEQIKKIQKDLSEFSEKYYDKMDSDIRFGTGKIAMISITVEKPFPLALAGRANFIVNNKKGKPKKIEMIINILPYEKQTKVILASQKFNFKALENYIGYVSNRYSLLQMIEIWMIYNSDHWFIKPSVWESLNIETQNKITDRILKINNENLEKLDFEIFDRDTYLKNDS